MGANEKSGFVESVRNYLTDNEKLSAVFSVAAGVLAGAAVGMSIGGLWGLAAGVGTFYGVCYLGGRLTGMVENLGGGGAFSKPALA